MLISELMTQAGLTSVHQTGGYRDDMIAYQDAREAGVCGFVCISSHGAGCSMIW